MNPRVTGPSSPASARSPWRAIRSWFDADAGARDGRSPSGIDWPRVLPFIGMHAGCLLVIPAGVSMTAIVVAVLLYALRMFAITGFFHRYFSHRAFRTSRAFQFVMAFVGTLAAQRGPIWWAAHHRRHHRSADQPGDIHSPTRQGFWRSHMGWFMTPDGFRTHTELVGDLLRYPELRLLDRFNSAPPLLLAAALFAAGAACARFAPSLETSGLQLVAWGFFVSTVVLYHATYTINSLAHLFGARRFAVADTSRNNAILALLTFGEGWHNNHHRFPHSARQGFYWWEIDLTWWGLRVLNLLGLIHDLRPVPASVLESGRRRTPPSPVPTAGP